MRRRGDSALVYELGLDRGFVPPPIRPVDAFEKVTGRDGIRVSYPLDGQPAAGSRRRRSADGQSREATLMVRHVRRDDDQLVRHLVREVARRRETRLTYDTRLAECVFGRENAPGAAHGAGSLYVAPDHAAIRALPEGEQDHVRAVLRFRTVSAGTAPN